MADRNSNPIFGLDLLRVLAISGVLATHSCYLLVTQTPRPAKIFLWGWLGVELFFVLSGFLIGRILLRELTRSAEIPTLLSFWKRRWFRTLPNYYLFLTLNVGFALYLGHALPNIPTYAFFIQNLAWRIPPFFVESWSLAIEEWFYFISGILFLGTTLILKRNVKIACLAVITSGLLGITIARCIVVSVSDLAWFWACSIVSIHLDGIMYGVLAAWISFYFPEAWKSRPNLFLIAGMMVITVPILWVFNHNHEEIYFLSRTSGFSLLSIGYALMFPFFDTWREERCFVAKAISFLSKISYSMYLCHVLILEIFRNSFPKLPEYSTIQQYSLVAIYLVVCIMVSAFFYFLYEKPMMNLRDRKQVSVPKH